MDAAGSERAHILGSSEGGNMACVFAATYPARTIGLLVWGSQARWTRTDDYPWGVSMEDAIEEIEYAAEHGITDEYLFEPDDEIPEEKKQLIRRFSRASATPGVPTSLDQRRVHQ